MMSDFPAWILCDFTHHVLTHGLMQVRNAQEAGAIAAIVYDNVYEPLIIMSKPLGHADPDIPAVFVAQKTGVVMQKFLTTGTVTVRIIQVSHRSMPT